MIGVIGSARKSEIAKCAASKFEPSQNTASTWFKKFELNWLASLLLDDDCARPDPAAADQVADLDLHDVTTAQFAIYSQVEQRAIAQPMFAVEPESDSPNLLRFQ